MSAHMPLRLSVDEAKAMADDADVTYLDLLDSHSYAEIDVQIEGAVRIAPERLGDQYQRLPKDRAVLAY